MLRLLKKKGAYHPKTYQGHSSCNQKKNMRHKQQYLLNFEQPDETAMALARVYTRAYDILIQVAEQQQDIRFNKLKTRLSEEMETITTEIVSHALRNVNSRSWRELGCILSSLVICRKTTPGLPMFKQAKAVGAILSMPEHNEQFEMVARDLQHKCYDAVRNKQGIR